MAKLFTDAFYTAIDSDGDPISGAKWNFYETGTTTRQDTFTDNALSVAHANPVVADAAGRFAPIYIKDVDYKAVLTDAADVVIKTIDPVHGRDDSALYLNIQSRGALGDGSTDDLANVQAVENDADDAGYIMLVPPVTASYRLNGRLVLSANVGLLGHGEGSYFKFDDAASAGDLEVSGFNTIDTMRLNFEGSQGIFATSGASDVRLLSIHTESDPANETISVQMNQPNTDRWWSIAGYYEDPSYAWLLNSGATGQGAFFIGNFVELAFSDAFAVNDTNRSYADVICALNVLSCDTTGSGGGSSGFVISVAGGKRIINALNSCYNTRQEAIHIEGQCEGLITLGTILDECDEDGVHILNRPFLTFDANTDVSLGDDEITITNHRMRTAQRVDYEIGAGTAIGGLTDEDRYYVIIVDDDTIQLATTPANAIAGTQINLTTQPASETHTLEAYSGGYVTTDIYARQKDLGRTDTGVDFIDDSNLSVQDQILSNVYTEGFATGVDFGLTKRVLASNIITANATNAIQLTGRQHRMSNIDRIIARDTDVGLLTRNAKVGHITFEDVTTLWSFTGSAGQGTTMKGHAGEVRWTHGGTGAEWVVLFPAGANDRIMGKLQAHAMLFGGTADNGMVIAELDWDGTTLTLTTTVSRVTGAASVPTFRVNGGNLEFGLTDAGGRVYEVTWDFDGYHYIE